MSEDFLEANFSLVASSGESNKKVEAARQASDTVVYFLRQTIRLLVNLFATILLSIWLLNILLIFKGNIFLGHERFSAARGL